MHPTLSLLLGRHYDGALAPEHAADLGKSGLTEETVRAHLVRSVPLAMIRPLLGFDSSEIRSALLFPFRSPAGGFMGHPYLKVFPPLTDARRHAVKYLQPQRTPARLYFTIPGLRELQGDCPIWLVEGPKKALAVAQLGFPTVGFCGIEGWHVTGSRELLPDFTHLRLRRRVVELVPDSDVQTHSNVERGARRFAEALAARGARVRLVRLPVGVAA